MTADQQLLKLTPCILCSTRFSVNDALHNIFFFETMVCHACYAAMQARPASECCFGKLEQYNQETKDCGERCVDRDICPQFINGSALHHTEHAPIRAMTIQRDAKEARTTAPKNGHYPFRGDQGMVLVFRDCVQGTTREILERRLVELALPYRASLQKLLSGKWGVFRWTFQEDQYGKIKIQLHRKR